MLKEDDPALADVKSVGFILCAGSLDENHPYCSRTCCQQSIKNAIALKEQDPKRPVYVWFKEVRTFGLLEEYYTKARELGVIFTRYDNDSLPQVSANGSVSGQGLSRPVPAPRRRPAARPARAGHAHRRRPRAAASSARCSRCRSPATASTSRRTSSCARWTSPPRASSSAAPAHYPKGIEETISQAYAAAGRAAAILAKPVIKAGGVVAEVDQDKCAACLTCVRVCPYEVPIIDPEAKKAKIEAAACQGCGVCVSECPVKASPCTTTPTRRSSPRRGALHGGELRWPTTLKTQVSRRRWRKRPRGKPVDPDFEPEIIVFACHYCAYAAADLAGSMRLQYPSNIRMIKLPCTGKLEIVHLLKAIEAGADGVYTAGCLEGECHYLKGNLWARKRIGHVRPSSSSSASSPSASRCTTCRRPWTPVRRRRNRVHQPHQGTRSSPLSVRQSTWHAAAREALGDVALPDDAVLLRPPSRKEHAQ